MEKKEKKLQQLLNLPRNRIRRDPLPDSLSLPTGFLGLTPYLALRGRSELEIFGCAGILCYEDCRIVLQLTKGYLRIRGRRLSMRSYHRTSMLVGGEIEGLDLPQDEKEALACASGEEREKRDNKEAGA